MTALLKDPIRLFIDLYDDSCNERSVLSGDIIVTVNDWLITAMDRPHVSLHNHNHDHNITL